MKLTSAALAAFCLLGAQAAQAGNLFHDYGTGFPGLGVVPTPGQGFSPYWGGNLTPGVAPSSAPAPPPMSSPPA